MPSAMYNLSKLVCLETSQEFGGGFKVPELKLRPFLTLDTSHVQLRNSKGHLIVHILIEDTHEDYGQGSESEVDQYNVGIVEEVGAIEVVVDTVPEKGERPHEILGGVSGNTE